MKKLLLLVLFLAAFVLRTWNLTGFPIGFTPDEASFGYDAYSILKTGADQWGHKFPLVLKSFGDFKSPLYAYLTVPSVAIFGLTKFAVRLPNAILGALSVFVIYLLAKKLSGSEKVGMIAAAFLAISSWHIMLSRGAFEASLITFFLPLGIYLFLAKKYDLSAVILGLNLFTYHSSKLITPIVFIAILIIFRKDIRKFVRPIVLFSVFFAAMIYTFYLGGGARISERSITDGALEAGATTKIELIQNGANPILARLMHNKYQVVVSRFVNNYSQYFSPRFLFSMGPAETTYGMIPGLGVIYIFDGILLLGIFPLFHKENYKKLTLLLISWLMLSVVPAALATGVGYSANRATAMIVPMEILISLGAIGWLDFLKKFDKKILFISSFFLALIVSNGFAKFFKLYFINSPKITAKGMLSGNLEAAYWLKDNLGGRKVIISRTLSEPHIYVAFANKWDPFGYQNATKDWKLETWVDQIPSYKLGNYIFQNEKPNLWRPDDFSKGAVPTKIFYYPDGTESIYVKLN